jgi:GntR family histidine utilization transcriptional repressor
MTGRARKGALHLRISADLASEIRSGAWRPGHRIPFEHELMARYGCARATAGKAVQALAAAGLIERRRRAGSFVARPPIQSAVLEIPELRAEVTGRGQIYGYELLSIRRRGPNRHDLDEGVLGSASAVLDLVCRHLADGSPFAVEERLINLDVVPEATHVDFRSMAPGAWLLDHVAWSEAEHKIGASSAAAWIAEGLGIEPGGACLTLKRWTWRSGDPVTYVRQTFPAEAFEVSARFVPKSFG